MEIQRRTYLDCLRILATVGVICVHASCHVINSSVFPMPPIGSADWNIAAVYDAVVRFCVPIFVMISGSLFIERNFSIKKLFSKYIFRIITAYFLWSLFYALMAGNRSLYSILTHTFSGGPRFAFLCYLVGLYLITPMLCQIVSSKKVTLYYLALCFLFCFFEPQVAALLSGRGIPYISHLAELTDGIVQKMNIQFVMGMTGYYLLGYVLGHYEVKKSIRIVIYFLGIVGVITTIVMTIFSSIRMGEADFSWYSYLSVNVLFESAAIFLLFKNVKMFEKLPNFWKLWIESISRYTFGVYLLHSWVLDTLLPNVFGLSASGWPAIISVPTITLLVFVISTIISGIIHQIPVLNRYVV